MTGVFRPIQVTNQPQRIQSFMIDVADVLLVNSDITNSIFMGNDQGTQPIPIPPLGSVSLSSADKHDIWLSTGGINVTVNAYLLPGGTNWTPSPAQIAAQINALGLATATNQGTQIGQGTTSNNLLNGTTPGALISGAGRTIGQEVSALIASGSAAGNPGGVPLLKFTQNLGHAANVNIPANGSVNLLNIVSFTQPSYEASIVLNLPSGSGTIPFALITFTWIDSTSGVSLSTKMFFVTAGNGPGFPLQFYLKGPARGNQLTVVIQNLDPAQAMTLQWVINQTSHLHVYDDQSQLVYSGTPPITYTNPNGTPSAGVIAFAGPTVLASATTTRLLAANSGKAKLGLNNTSAAGVTISAFLADPVSAGNGLYGTASGRYAGIQNLAAGATQVIEVALPHGPLLLQLVNNSSTTSATLNCGLIVDDY